MFPPCHNGNQIQIHHAKSREKKPSTNNDNNQWRILDDFSLGGDVHF